MKQPHFELQWPRENLFLSGFAHEIRNYRYHWHVTDYELNILLHGSQEFCIGTEHHVLEEDDVLLVNPGAGHGSFAQHANTRTLVLHVSASAFKPYLKKGFAYEFPACISTQSTRDETRFRRLRHYASQVYLAAHSDSPFALLTAKASAELLLATLGECFEPQIIPKTGDEDMQHLETINRLISFIEAHYQEKITLEDLAQYVQYNRTYVSTLFKNTVGVNFYEYLSRVRFQKALLELSRSSKNLTEIALDNGFPDLKSFRARFKETLHRSPTEYRAMLSPDRVLDEQERSYISDSDPLLQEKLHLYAQI